MFDIGFWELFLIFILLLFVVGPDKLPVVAEYLGRWFGKIQRYFFELKDSIQNETNSTSDDISSILEDQKNQIKDLEEKYLKHKKRIKMAKDNSDSSFNSLIPHLKELRTRFLKSLIFVLVIFVILFPFADLIYNQLAEPLLDKLPAGSNMIAIDVASPFFIPFKLVLILSVFISIPFLLYHLWMFTAPGLYEKEKKLVLPILISSSLLFYLGAAFAYFVVFPLLFGFFISIAEGISVMTDIGRYLDFVITLFFAFGLAFEVPIVTIILVITNVSTPKSLAAKRPYVIVGAFVVGMLLTPPDVISQTLLAIPIWLLYELGIFFSKFISSNSKISEEVLYDNINNNNPGDKKK